MAAECIKNFNNIFEQLLIQISPMCGSTYHYRFKQIIQFNAILPIEQFLIHALQHKDKIINKDESYFTIKNDEEKENSEKYIVDLVKIREQALNNKNNITDNDTKNTINNILLLQDIYYSLDSESKENIWSIFQALLIIGEDYICIKYK